MLRAAVRVHNPPFLLPFFFFTVCVCLWSTCGVRTQATNINKLPPQAETSRLVYFCTSYRSSLCNPIGSSHIFTPGPGRLIWRSSQARSIPGAPPRPVQGPPRYDATGVEENKMGQKDLPLALPLPPARTPKTPLSSTVSRVTIQWMSGCSSFFCALQRSFRRFRIRWVLPLQELTLGSVFWEVLCCMKSIFTVRQLFILVTVIDFDKKGLSGAHSQPLYS